MDSQRELWRELINFHLLTPKAHELKSYTQCIYKLSWPLKQQEIMLDFRCPQDTIWWWEPITLMIVAVKFFSYCISSFQKLIFESGRTQQYSVMHLVRCPAVLVAGGLVGTIRLAASLLKDTVFTCIFRRKIIVSDHCRHRLVFQDRLDNPTQKRRHHFTVDNWSFLFLDPCAIDVGQLAVIRYC